MAQQITPGTFVTLEHEVGREVGIVVATWLDEHGIQDCYVAFYGEDWPKLDTKPAMPYILRYYASSLRAVKTTDLPGIDPSS